MEEEIPYNLWARMLHHVALGSIGVAQTSFDLDQTLAGSKLKTAAPVKPVYVTGLARSGTTILTDLLYQSGAFSSLTYRDMPFVLMPGIWHQISSPFQRRGQKQERAHGDGMQVSYDSPEAFEEIFWRVFCGSDYIGEKSLFPHTIPEPVQENYRSYISRLCALEDQKRYLAKNNNNLLRLESLKNIFEGTRIIIPFRSPVSHARSLLNQHVLFRKRQKDDRFVEKYMNWLGHFEFGNNHKPFSFHSESLPFTGDGVSPETLEYWLAYWIHVHDRLCSYAPDEFLFVCYETLCEKPGKVLGRLFGDIDLEVPDTDVLAKQVRSQIPGNSNPACSQERIDKSFEIYRELQHKCRVL